MVEVGTQVVVFSLHKSTLSRRCPGFADWITKQGCKYPFASQFKIQYDSYEAIDTTLVWVYGGEYSTPAGASATEIYSKIEDILPVVKGWKLGGMVLDIAARLGEELHSPTHSSLEILPLLKKLYGLNRSVENTKPVPITVSQLEALYIRLQRKGLGAQATAYLLKCGQSEFVPGIGKFIKDSFDAYINFWDKLGEEEMGNWRAHIKNVADVPDWASS